MKRVFYQGKRLLGEMHSYPFFVLLLFLYGAVAAFSVCGVVAWIPQVLTHPHQADYIAQQWFQVGNTLVGVGGVTAPIMDLILKKDI